MGGMTGSNGAVAGLGAGASTADFALPVEVDAPASVLPPAAASSSLASSISLRVRFFRRPEGHSHMTAALRHPYAESATSKGGTEGDTVQTGFSPLHRIRLFRQCKQASWTRGSLSSPVELVLLYRISTVEGMQASHAILRPCLQASGQTPRPAACRYHLM